MSDVLSQLPYINLFAYCSEWIKKSTLTKRFRSDFVGALYNVSAKLAIYHFVCSHHAGFAEWEQKLQVNGLPR